VRFFCMPFSVTLSSRVCQDEIRLLRKAASVRFIYPSAAPHDGTGSQNSVLTHELCQKRCYVWITEMTNLLRVAGKLRVFVNRIYICVSQYSH